MTESLPDILAGVTPTAINLDKFGRVVITDRELARKVSDLINRDPLGGVSKDDQNLGCCKNGYQCGCASAIGEPVSPELLDIASRFVGPGRP